MMANSEWRMANRGAASGSVSLFATPSSLLAPEAKARKSAEDFEAMFLEQTLDRLFASEGTEGPLGDNGTGGEIYRSMLAREYAGSIARSGGVGIADQVYSEILKLQESEHGRR